MGACQSALQGDKYLNTKPSKKSFQQDRLKNQQFAEDLVFIERVPLFSRLSKADIPLVVSALERKDFRSGEVVIQEGEKGNEFFLIKSGEARVYKDNVEIASLKPGDYFGEASLLEDTPRNATVKACQGVLTVLCLTRQKFEDLGVRNRLRFPRRRAVAADGGDVESAKPVRNAQEHEALQKKTPTDEILIRTALDHNKYLSKMLSPDQMLEMIAVAYKTNVKAGEKVVTEGSLVADMFYIVSSGKFTVRKLVKHEQTNGGSLSMEESIAGELQAGDTFGELALLYNAPRAATVEALSDSLLWVIDRHDFKKILRKQAQQRNDFYMRLVEKTELLKELLTDEKRALVECFVQLHYKQGQTILREGEEGNTFYIMYQGTVGVSTEEKGKIATLTASPENCQYFGEQALVNPERRNASITVESQSVSLLVLERSTFEQILGPLKEILQHNENAMAGKRQSILNHRPTTTPAKACCNVPSNFQKPKFESLQKVGVLGCGGFGSVTLQRVKKTKQMYALKAVSKGYVLKMQLCEQILNERKILSMTNSPFIAQFYCTYNHTGFLFFLLEACLGGEVFAQYGRRGFHGSVPHCVFYSACVVKAFEHLHDRKIIYRDLKPENMLLDQAGYCKLTDMGLAKFVIGRTYTTCGTPDYFAPEIIQSTGHTNAVDWWTFGILVYELLVGRTPFDGIDPQMRYRKILSGVERHDFPREVPAKAVDLIQQTCKTDPSHRMCMRPGGVRENLYQHPFYDASKWELLEKRTLKAPFRPRSKPSDPLYHFGGTAADEEPPTIPYTDPRNGWDAEF
ncbi:unnamed protein product [Amoebophrya sp. A25]|nr:unnamed protein product [Amoebophrya sp. A25]|eukprot:GSA25T00024278001.1